MADPAQIDIVADRRVPYREFFSFLEVDWTSSTFKIQVRRVKDTTGTALIDLTTPNGVVLVYAGTATVSAHIAAGRLDEAPAGMALTDNLLLSQIIIFLDVSTLPIAEVAGDDLACFYDIIRTPPGGSPILEMPMRGNFTVRAGVTIP